MPKRMDPSNKTLVNKSLLISREVKEELENHKKYTCNCVYTRKITTGKDKEKDPGNVMPFGT